MAEYIEREAVLDYIRYKVCQGEGNIEHRCQRGSCAYCGICEIMCDISSMPAADVQPLFVVAEHIKNRLYETAFNTTEEKARDVIADMAERIDFWIDELKDGDAK